jgi:hypothetical protein
MSVQEGLKSILVAFSLASFQIFCKKMQEKGKNEVLLFTFASSEERQKVKRPMKAVLRPTNFKISKALKGSR